MKTCISTLNRQKYEYIFTYYFFPLLITLSGIVLPKVLATSSFTAISNLLSQGNLSAYR